MLLRCLLLAQSRPPGFCPGRRENFEANFWLQASVSLVSAPLGDIRKILMRDAGTVWGSKTFNEALQEAEWAAVCVAVAD